MRALPLSALLLVACLAPLPAGAEPLNPTLHYEVRGTRKLEGAVGIGVFTYLPFQEGKVHYETEVATDSEEPLILGSPVASHVRRGTGEELYHAGVRIDQDAKFAIGGEVLELRMRDEGVPMHWLYGVRYTVLEPQSGKVVYEVSCPRLEADSERWVLSGDYAEVINKLIFAGYECLIADPRIPEFLRAE